MDKKQLIVGLLLFFCVPVVSAYFENYPPYKFKNGPFKHLEAQELVSFDKSDYKSKDGKVVAKLTDSGDDAYEFILKVGTTILADKKDDQVPLPYAVYMADLDKNGLQDFILISNYRGVGLGAFNDKVDIYLKKADLSYQQVTYDTMSADLGDFIDLNKDGKYEVIITDMYSGDKHNYFTYDIYEIEDYELVNANVKFKGFPKFVWITDNPNDKDTVHLTKELRAARTKEKNASIKYADIK